MTIQSASSFDQNSPNQIDLDTGSSIAELEYSTIEEFLKFVEKRAFQMARLSTRSTNDAHDIVQEAMYKLVEKYSNKQPGDWKPLFFKIMSNKVTDYYRRNAIKDRVFARTNFTVEDQNSYAARSIDIALAPKHDEPDASAETNIRTVFLSECIKKLSHRQRQAFMLRTWEGFSTRDTAKAMSCSEGSVKTHHSRAVNRLRNMLEGFYG
mgnify:FL=1